MVGHNHIPADPDSVLDSMQSELNECLVHVGSVENRSASIRAGRDEVDRIFREKPSKSLR